MLKTKIMITDNCMRLVIQVQRFNVSKLSLFVGRALINNVDCVHLNIPFSSLHLLKSFDKVSGSSFLFKTRYLFEYLKIMKIINCQLRIFQWQIKEL